MIKHLTSFATRITQYENLKFSSLKTITDLGSVMMRQSQKQVISWTEYTLNVLTLRSSLYIKAPMCADGRIRAPCFVNWAKSSWLLNKIDTWKAGHTLRHTIETSLMINASKVKHTVIRYWLWEKSYSRAIDYSYWQ